MSTISEDLCRIVLEMFLRRVYDESNPVDEDKLMKYRSIHPPLHVMVHPSFTATADPTSFYLPDAFESIILHRDVPIDELCAHIVFRQWTPSA